MGQEHSSRVSRATRDGVVAMAPLVVGYTPFALAVGAVVASHGDRAAGVAAVTALFAASLGGTGHGAVDPALAIAAAPSVWLAARGATMLRVVGVGAAAYAVVIGAGWIVQLGSP